MAKKSRQQSSAAMETSGAIESVQETSIDTSVLLSDIIDRFNGPSGLAAAIYQEFINARPGSMVRTRTIEMINRLVMKNTEMELSNLRKPADLDDDELEAVAEKLLKKREKERGREASEAGDSPGVSPGSES